MTSLGRGTDAPPQTFVGEPPRPGASQQRETKGSVIYGLCIQISLLTLYLEFKLFSIPEFNIVI